MPLKSDLKNAYGKSSIFIKVTGCKNYPKVIFTYIKNGLSFMTDFGDISKNVFFV